jgi:hypothetical protein
MDSRHEAHEQEILNSIINFINRYIQENIEEIIKKDHLRHNIKIIATAIYEYAQMWIDVEGVLSNKNFLSVDVVLLPPLHDSYVPQAKFSEVIENINSVLQNDRSDGNFYQGIKKIIIDSCLG